MWHRVWVSRHALTPILLSSFAPSNPSSPLLPASFLPQIQWSHHPSIKPTPANGDAICAVQLWLMVEGENELIALMNYICIIDKLYFCPASINIYLYNVSLCLIVSGWTCVLKLLAGRTTQERCQLCLYAGLQLGLLGRELLQIVFVCVQTEDLVIWQIHSYSKWNLLG